MLSECHAFATLGLMGILVFIIVIVALILVHELGHFIVAKRAGMRVDEFGLGYPPRALTIAKKGETEYTLNWLPFGGFVKIYGEDPVNGGGASSGRAFFEKNRAWQIAVLVAGVGMNFLFAYVLITGALIAGMPRALEPHEIAGAHDVSLAVSSVVPGSPAAEANIKPGDTILHAEDGHMVYEGKDPQSFTEFVTSGGGNATVALTVRHPDGGEEVVYARPVTGLVENDPARAALGVSVGTIGKAPMAPLTAVIEGARLTWGATVLTAEGLWHFFYGIFAGQADFSQVAGPVGIAGVVGGASESGLGALLSIAAIISINLAIINLIPIPALDGGRLFVVIVEGITRRRIPQKALQAATSVSFVLLILLMLVVTANDIYRIAS